MSKKKKKKTGSLLVAQKLQRKLAIQDGFYDGRFKEKTVPDKKKEASKRWARKKSIKEDEKKKQQELFLLFLYSLISDELRKLTGNSAHH